jgi:hypothetical protein
MERRRRKIFSSRGEGLNRKQMSELVEVITSLKEESSESLKRLPTGFKETTARSTFLNPMTKARGYKFYLFNLMSNAFLAYIHLLSGKLQNLNTKADEALKIIKS